MEHTIAIYQVFLTQKLLLMKILYFKGILVTKNLRKSIIVQIFKLINIFMNLMINLKTN